jgi:hypothetical protein
LKFLSCAFDLLSREAFFQDSVRQSVWGERFEVNTQTPIPVITEELQYWMPLLLNAQHSKKALPDIKAAIVAIAKNKPQGAPLSGKLPW